MTHLPYAVAAWLFIVGLYGVISSRNLIHLVICVSVIQSSSYVLLLAIGYRAGRPAPIFADIPANTLAVDRHRTGTWLSSCQLSTPSLQIGGLS